MAEPLDAAADALAGQWAAAWNAHDPTRLERFVAADADWVTVAGVHLRGREEIVRVHVALHAGPLRDSVWANEGRTITQVAPGVALMHLRFGVRGDRGPDGSPRPPRRGIFSWLLVADADGWRIRAAHATNVA